MADLLTVLWKEWRDMPALRGRSGVITLLSLLLFGGIILPLQMGAGFVSSPVALFGPLWMPFVLVLAVSADMVAGERERHTLESLLATRLPDRALLVGKLLAMVSVGWLVSLGTMLSGLVVANVGYGHGRLLLYPAYISVGIPVLSLLLLALLAGLGAVCSAYAPTVRQAGQNLALFSLAPALVLPAFFLLPRHWIAGAVHWLAGVGGGGVVAALALLLLVGDAIVLSVACSRFQRIKLIR